MKTSTISVAIMCLVVLTGCLKDPTGSAPVIPVPSAKGVYVVDEGNFGRGNASLSYLDLGSYVVYNNVFTAVNGKNLGDVATGMVLRGPNGYIVVNNSNRIEVIDLATNSELGVIPTGDGSSPRRIAFVNDTIALETNLYEGTVGIVDLKRYRVVNRLAVGANPDGIAIAAGRAFVANSGFGTGNTVSVIDLSPFSTGDAVSGVVLQAPGSIRVGDNPGGVRITPYGDVYVVCGGSYGDGVHPNTETSAKIFVIQPSTQSVTDSIMIGGHAFDIAISGVDGVGYVASSDSVFRIDTRTHRNTGVFLAGSYYAVGVEEVSGDVYLADPKDYVQAGTVDVYAASGQLRSSFTVGIIPGWFAFKR